MMFVLCLSSATGESGIPSEHQDLLDNWSSPDEKASFEKEQASKAKQKHQAWEAEKSRIEKEVELLEMIADNIDSTMSIVDVHTQLKPFKIFGIEASMSGECVDRVVVGSTVVV